MENVYSSLYQLKQLKSLGPKIAIDDFGTGYSSLGYLQQFPFDILKIDRCFISQIDQNSKNAAIVEALIALARQLNIRTVAEGVESAIECEFLRRHHCNKIQGYLFSRPISAESFADLLRLDKRLV